MSLIQQLIEIAYEHQKEYVFLSTTGKSAVRREDVSLNFRRYKAEGNLRFKCTPYVLRHTFATEMVKKGIDLFTLQRMMGHKNITTTRQYVFIDNDRVIEKHKEINLLESLLE